jgi:hypothetical protein
VAEDNVATVASKEESFVVVGQTETRTPVFSVLVKRTYQIHPGRVAERIPQANPLVQADVYYDHGDPESSTVKFENDLAPYKLKTDVVLIGKAYAPGGHPTTEMGVGLAVGDHRKVIRLIGERRCIYRADLPPSFTEPEPFTEMEMRYERAYGGTYLRDDPVRMFPYPRNHQGAGFVLKNTPEAVEGLALPNLEDPEDLLTPERIVLGERERWNGQPLPQGFGWFQRTWYPRCSFVGSVPGFVDPDEVMREETLGLVPKGQIALARRFKLPSFDVRFNNGASLGLALPYLKGGEFVRLRNPTPDGVLDFVLPNDVPRMMLDIGLGENTLESVLHTVCIRVDEMALDLVWRGAHPYPGVDWLPEMKRLTAVVT